MRMLHIFWLLLMAVVLVESNQNLIMYEMDQHCQPDKIPVNWLGDNDVMIIHGKTSDIGGIQECMIMFGPNSSATKKKIRVEFMSFYINDCGVELTVQQSPKSTFDGEAFPTLFYFSCKTGPRYGVAYEADAGNNIWLILKKSDTKIINYNFQINITLTKHAVAVEPMSLTLSVSIGILVLIFILGFAVLAFRCYKLQRLPKQGMAEHSSLHSQDQLGRMTTTTRYSDLRENERLRRDSQHSQACILGSVDADGNCTVCNRHHDDFAHVVDVDRSGSIIETASSPREIMRQRQNGVGQANSTHACILGSQSADGRCTVCNRYHEDFAHVVDVNSEGLVQQTVHSGHSGRHDANRNFMDLSYSDDSDSSTPRLNLRNGTNASSNNRQNRSGSRREDDEDDDVDLSGNDLIPPSYDLSPPSYDEAVNMPKPDMVAVVSGRQRQETTGGGYATNDPAETDPLYQNLDGLGR